MNKTQPKDNLSSLEEALMSFRRKLMDVMRKKSEDLSCPMSQADTMMYIAEKKTPSMKEIAGYLKVTPPSATSIIGAMEKKGLVKRITNKDDRRTIRISLTPKAFKIFDSFHKAKSDLVRKMLTRLEEKERKQFIRILNKLTKE